jgi:hypothetical protein
VFGCVGSCAVCRGGWRGRGGGNRRLGRLAGWGPGRRRDGWAQGQQAAGSSQAPAPAAAPTWLARFLVKAMQKTRSMKPSVVLTSTCASISDCHLRTRERSLSVVKSMPCAAGEKGSEGQGSGAGGWARGPGGTGGARWGGGQVPPKGWAWALGRLWRGAAWGWGGARRCAARWLHALAASAGCWAALAGGPARGCAGLPWPACCS